MMGNLTKLGVGRLHWEELSDTTTVINCRPNPKRWTSTYMGHYFTTPDSKRQDFLITPPNVKPQLPVYSSGPVVYNSRPNFASFP